MGIVFLQHGFHCSLIIVATLLAFSPASFSMINQAGLCKKLLQDSGEITFYSTWGSVQFDQIQKNASHFSNFFFRHPHGTLPVVPNTQAELYSEQLAILHDLETFHLNPKSFRKEFKRIHGGDPDARDYYDFYKERLKVLKQGYEEIAASFISFQHDPRLGALIREKKEYRFRYFDLAIKELKRSVELEYDEIKLEMILRMQFTLAKGLRAELKALFTDFQGATHFSAEISEIPFFHQAIEHFKKQIPNIAISPARFSALKIKYPKVIYNHLLVKANQKHLEETGGALTPYQVLEYVSDWISGKEADIAVVSHKIIKFIEVKDMFIDEEVFYIKHNGHMNDQMTEIEQIIDLLGLRERVEIILYSPHGIEPGLQKKLLKRGIHAISRYP